MAASSLMSIDVREATVAAAITGAVVVVLGYASGLGLRTPLVQAAVVRPPAAVAVSAPPTIPAPLPVLLPAAAPVLPVAPRVPRPAPVHQYRHPSPPPPVVVTPTPQPAAPTCTPGLLDGVLGTVDALLGPVLQTVLGTALTPACPAADAALRQARR